MEKGLDMTEQFEQRMKQSQAAKRTNLAQWFVEQAGEQELDLPSGLHVVVRDIDFEELMLAGGIPNTLISMFDELEGLSNQQAVEKFVEKDKMGFYEMVNAYVKACMVEPRLGDVTNLENNILGINDMRGKDKMFIFNWLNREAANVKAFREEEKQSGDPASAV